MPSRFNIPIFPDNSNLPLTPQHSKLSNFLYANMGSVQAFFEANPSIKFVRLHWVDFSGVLRTRFVPKARCLDLADSRDKYILAQNCMITPISASLIHVPKGPQRWELHPDWASLRICGHHPGHATVMCFVNLVDDQDTFARCPRHALRRCLKDFESKYNTSVLLGFEIEFTLLDPSSALAKPLDRIAEHSMTAGLRGETLKALEEVFHAMEVSGIYLYHFHTEIQDQLEIALAPLPPMQAIDALMITQEAIRTVLVQYGLRASMAPRAVFNGPQNGTHMHISLNPAHSPDPFIVGILDKMKTLCAFGMPNYDSYTRVIEDGGGQWIGFGTENRSLPIRKISVSHWEFRFLDATANVYLYAAIIFEAGSRGIRMDMQSQWKDCWDIWPAYVDAEKRAEYGIVEEMPKSLRETLDAAKKDEDLKGWIGKSMLEQYILLKEKEIELFSKMTDEEMRQRYLLYF